MRSTHLPAIARARFLVGALGEHLRWWPSDFTKEASRRSLEILFPQTSTRAGLESVVEVARRDHDEKLNPRSFHLFRLPVHLEDRLAGWLATPGAALAWPPAVEASLFAELARASSTASQITPGPLCLGKPAQLNHAAPIQEVAAVYLAAARAGIRVVPYFED